MEFSTGAATGMLRLGLQVVSTAKRPILDIYYELRHIHGHDFEYEVQGRFGAPPSKQTLPHSHLVLPFFLVNLGTVRAEKIRLELLGDFIRHVKWKLSDRPIFQGLEIPQLAPAQAFPLFILDPHDFSEIEPTGKPGVAKPPFRIKMSYDSGGPWYHRPIRLPDWKKQRRSYTGAFEFVPGLFEGADIPPAE